MRPELLTEAGFCPSSSMSCLGGYGVTLQEKSTLAMEPGRRLYANAMPTGSSVASLGRSRISSRRSSDVSCSRPRILQHGTSTSPRETALQDRVLSIRRFSGDHDRSSQVTGRRSAASSTSARAPTPGRDSGPDRARSWLAVFSDRDPEDRRVHAESCALRALMPRSRLSARLRLFRKVSPRSRRRLPMPLGTGRSSPVFKRLGEANPVGPIPGRVTR
jgi:hypothetical protein